MLCVAGSGCVCVHARAFRVRVVPLFTRVWMRLAEHRVVIKGWLGNNRDCSIRRTTPVPPPRAHSLRDFPTSFDIPILWQHVCFSMIIFKLCTKKMTPLVSETCLSSIWGKNKKDAIHLRVFSLRSHLRFLHIFDIYEHDFYCHLWDFCAISSGRIVRNRMQAAGKLERIQPSLNARFAVIDSGSITFDYFTTSEKNDS